MNLEFKTYRLKENSIFYKKVIKGSNKLNEFIIVGEEMFKTIECFKVLQLTKKGFALISGLNLDELAIPLPKVDMGWEMKEIDVPKEFLTIDIIKDIKRLNSY